MKCVPVLNTECNQVIVRKVTAPYKSHALTASIQSNKTNVTKYYSSYFRLNRNVTFWVCKALSCITSCQIEFILFTRCLVMLRGGLVHASRPKFKHYARLTTQLDGNILQMETSTLQKPKIHSIKIAILVDLLNQKDNLTSGRRVWKKFFNEFWIFITFNEL